LAGNALFSRLALPAEAFEIDAARVSLPALDGLDIPPRRTAMLAVNDELTAGAAGDRLAAEALANLLAVHLIRNVTAPGSPARRAQGALPRKKLRTVTEYVEEHRAGLSLEQMAAATHLSPFHFARQFKAATGLPPHQYVIARRVERARQLLQTDSDFPLAEVAASAGFSDQNQLSHHIKRLVGVTPGQYRKSSRIA
jgi:AraC family transcriptional regulator